jgi:NTE family protein
MQVHVHEKTYGPNLFRFGLTFDSDLEGNARFSGRARLNTVELNRRGAEWRNDFALGTQSHVASEWYQPLDLQRRWFIAPRLAYRSDYEDVYAGDLTSRYRMQEAQARVDFGVQIGRPGELRTGPYFGWGRAEIKTGAPGLPETEGRLGGWWTRIAVDVVDAPDAPTSGAAGVLELTLDREAFGSEYGFDRLGAECDIFATWLGNTGFLELEGGTSMGTDLPPFAKFRIGGLHSLSGLHAGELVGDAFGVLRVGLSRPITGEVDLFGTRLHVAGWFEAGNAWPTTDDALDGLRYTGTVSLWADTILGPVHVAEGWADGGDATLYITLGQQFGLGR